MKPGAKTGPGTLNAGKADHVAGILDWPDPSNFVNNLLDGQRRLGYGYEPPYFFYEDERYIERMRAAHRLRGEARVAAYRDLVVDMMRESPPSAVFMTGSCRCSSSRSGSTRSAW
jgi:hypothetical protein